MPPLHDAAAQGYAAHAGTYASGRPDYPPAIDAWLRTEIGLGPGRTVLDLGTGTGKFLPYLKATGASVVAVEPVAAMRDQCAALHPDVTVLEGTAEHIPLPDAAVDAMTCAQAFHWFASRETMAEIRRVLRPGGQLGLVWNVRDEQVGWVAALTEIMAPYESDTPRYRTGAWRRVFPAEGFAPARERHCAHAHVGPPGRVILDRILSVSFIAALPQEEQARVAARLRALLDATPGLRGRETVSFPYETRMFAVARSD